MRVYGACHYIEVCCKLTQFISGIDINPLLKIKRGRFSGSFGKLSDRSNQG